jgi:glycosyltransferase involved in cell wall biosynthesis
MSGIHQFVPMLHRSDAVGRHTLRLQEILHGRGIESDIYVELPDAETAAETRPFAAYAGRAASGDVLVYQFATASGLAAWLAERNETLVVNYHNVTPPEAYAPWDNGLARHQLQARAELALLARRATLGLAVSAYNEAELRGAGYARTAVVPPAAMAPAPTPEHRNAAGPRAGGTRWVSVGRLAPNKAVQHAVAALAVARAHHDPGATLQLLGRSVVPAYTGALRRYVDELGLHDAVAFRGPVSDDELGAALAAADVLVVTSEHEGFGVPVIEAMAAGLPVVANRSSALPEVVGEGGVLVDAADPYGLADAIGALLGDDGRRAALQEAAARQVTTLDLPGAGDRAVDLVAALRV